MKLLNFFLNFAKQEQIEVKPLTRIESLQQKQNKVDRIIAQLCKEGDLNNLIRAEITYRHIVNQILFFKRYNQHLN